MKKYAYVLLLFLFFSGIISITHVDAKKSLSGKTILIDIGHGGIDPGTSYGDIYEKDINLKIGMYLKEELETLGATVIATRSGDYDLSSPGVSHRKKSDFNNRIRLINNEDNDFYVSIHLNYLSDTRYSGPQVFYNKKNSSFAKVMQSVMNENLHGKREEKKIPDHTYMFQRLNIPGLLIECGFLSNTRERELLQTNDYQRKVAKSIARGLKKILS